MTLDEALQHADYRAALSLLDADLPLVEQIYGTHREIKGLVVHVEQQVYQLFALQQPMASDLRAMLVVLRILHEIELTGGLMRNVARATRRLYPRQLPPRIRGIIERMGAQASVQTHLAVDAFADGDEAVAAALPDMDDVMDDLQKELFRAIFAGFSGESTDEAALRRLELRPGPNQVQRLFEMTGLLERFHFVSD